MKTNRYCLRRLLLVAVFLPLIVLLSGCPTPQPRDRDEPTVALPLVVHPPEGAVLHVIQRGDTLYSVARKHGCELREILMANPNVEPRKLEPGQVIVIPLAEAEPDTPATRKVEEPERPPERPKLVEPPHRRHGHAGPLPAEKKFIWPLRGRILSRFGRPAPWRHEKKNNGIDIRASPGQDVAAAKSGKVHTCDDVGVFGEMVVMAHGDGTVTVYAHLRHILIEHGTWAKQGETIAAAGSSGWASGTELHFRIMQGDRHVDPLKLLPK